MVNPRTSASIALGFALGTVFTIACNDSSRNAVASIIGDALDVAYTGATSGLAASTVQGAIDELVGKVNQANAKVGELGQLATATKTSVVAALNEVKATADAAGGPTVYFQSTQQSLSAGQTLFTLGGLRAGSLVDAEGLVGRAGTITSFMTRSSDATPADANVVLTLLVNGTPTTLTRTFAAGAAAGTSAVAGSVNVVPGDLITVKVENTGTAASAARYLASFELK